MELDSFDIIDSFRSASKQVLKSALLFKNGRLPDLF